jgi:hypothetical protein
MNTNWYDASLDARGSLNLPADLKRELGLGVASPLFIRVVEGVIVMVPMSGDAAKAQKDGTLEAWVDARLHSTLPPAPVTVGTLALAEAARTQRAREKHEMKMREMQMQIEVFAARRAAIQATQCHTSRSAADAAPNIKGAMNMLAHQKEAEEAEAKRQADAALQQATSELPQATP